MELVERGALLTHLRVLLAQARAGTGSIVLLGGEAGAGKTTVTRAFVATEGDSSRVLWGTCDPLVTPEALGPFHDMAPLAPVMARQLPRVALLRALLDELRKPPATVMVVEDAHWADDATLDALRFLGRRIHETSGLCVVTFRNDAWLSGAMFRSVLGDLATAPGCRRLEVPLLSPEAVASLAAGHAISPERLYEVTAGNAFYVTEVLAAPGWTVPPTVTDAVLARISRLEPAARTVVEVVSLAPGGLQPAIAVDLADGAVEPLDACIQLGVLVMNLGLVTFRHELARLAVEGSMPASRRQRLHRRLLDRLELSGDDAARLAHHADAAGDLLAVLRYAPAAARDASHRGAHRAASEHLKRAVEAAEGLPPGKLADLVSAWASESMVFDDPAKVLGLRRRALHLRRQAGDRLGEGRELLALSRMTARLGDATEASRLGADAVAILERLPPGPDLAFAYASVLFGAVDDYQVDEVIRRADDVIDLAANVGAPAATILALRSKAQAEILAGRIADGLESYEDARRVALNFGDQDGAISVAISAASDLLNLRRFDDARHRLEQAIEDGREFDLDYYVGAAEVTVAQIDFEQGRWEDGEERINLALRDVHRYPLTRSRALAVLGRIAARRGAAHARAILDEAMALVERSDPWIRWDVILGQVEVAWFAGSLGEIPTLIGDHYRYLRKIGFGRAANEYAFWLWRAGAEPEPPLDPSDPYSMQMAGDWHGAADVWAAFGCPYEQAEALADGDETAMRQALAIFTRLGADPAANWLRGRMRRAGLSKIPARPHLSSREAPGQLTRRQLEVLQLLEGGLTNREIAGRLFITEKTAGNHVSAILAKLDARSRSKAASTARKMGIFPAQR